MRTARVRQCRASRQNAFRGPPSAGNRKLLATLLAMLPCHFDHKQLPYPPAHCPEACLLRSKVGSARAGHGSVGVVLIEERIKAKLARRAVSSHRARLNDAIEAPLRAFAGRSIRTVPMKDHKAVLRFQFGYACVERSYKRVPQNLPRYRKDVTAVQNIHHSFAIFGLIAKTARLQNRLAQSHIRFRLPAQDLVAHQKHLLRVLWSQRHACRNHPTLSGERGGRAPWLSRAKAVYLPASHMVDHERRR